MPKYTVIGNKVEISDGENYYAFFLSDVKELRRFITSRPEGTNGQVIQLVHLVIGFRDDRKDINIFRGKIIADRLDRLYQTIKEGM